MLTREFKIALFIAIFILTIIFMFLPYSSSPFSNEVSEDESFSAVSIVVRYYFTPFKLAEDMSPHALAIFGSTVACTVLFRISLAILIITSIILIISLLISVFGDYDFPAFYIGHLLLAIVLIIKNIIYRKSITPSMIYGDIIIFCLNIILLIYVVIYHYCGEE